VSDIHRRALAREAPLKANNVAWRRAKKAQEASRSLVEAQRRDMRREELRSVIAKAELVDPMESLPVELCLHILSFLSMAQLARSCLVSSLWRYIATGATLPHLTSIVAFL
jgi:hypothetical protein